MLCSSVALAAVDTDNDGLENQIEISNKLDPFDSDTDNDGLVDGHPYEGLTDTDKDGVVNALDGDSDDDGLVDGLEAGINSALVPSDTDITSANFKSDLDISTKTNPLLSDSDNDGLLDGEEDKNKNGLFEPKGTDGVIGSSDDETNPNLADSDGDGMSDYYEVKYSLNPNDPVDTKNDYDNDGLTNLQEYNGGVNSLNPWDSDCDDDGLLDGDVREGFKDTDLDGIVNALDNDSDNDGLMDGLEAGITINDITPGTNSSKCAFDKDPTTKTDPLNSDTDGDGLLDGQEDRNKDGVFDKDGADDKLGTGDDETDPLDRDTDDDGLLDGDALEGFQDSDGDGLVNALDTDSDNDGLPDGLEAGLTKDKLDSDTDISKGNFISDKDPATTTDPTKKDTDGDGVSDGEEDLNLDGKYDKGETDPNNPVSEVTSNPVIVYPENNSVVYSRRPFIRGTAQKNIVLEILDNGKKIGEADVDSEGNFVFSPREDLELGEHFLQARVKSWNVNLILSSSGTTFTIMPFTSALSSTPRNYPNPFNPDTGTTVIYYELNADSDISIRIFNLRGEKIYDRDFTAGAQGGTRGLNQVIWNGRDDFGEVCASGVYLGAIISNGKVLDRFKIAIIR